MQFDASLRALRTKLALSTSSSAIRSIALADSVAPPTCTNKRKTLDAWENGKHTLTWETTYSDGSTFTQEHRYDQAGRVYFVKTIHDPGHGETPTSVTIDGTKDLSGRSEYWEQQANYAALTAGSLGTLGGIALAAPEPIASKATAAALGLFASGFMAEAALFKMLAAYYGRPNYFPDTLDQTRCEGASTADAGAPSPDASAATPIEPPKCTSAQASKTSATWDKCLTKYGKAWVFGNGTCSYWSLPQGVECRAQCQATCGQAIPQCVQVRSTGGWPVGSKECVTL